MNTLNILFFGSTADSVLVAEKLYATRYPLLTLNISAVVTQPPRPVGRKRVVTPTPVEIWAKEHDIVALSFPSNPEKSWLYADETQVIDALEPIKADLLVSASYGQKIPTKTLADATFGGLNVHPSLLPRWRGGDPVPWAILTGDHQTGVTVVSLSEKFDEGLIYAQEKIPITDQDTSGLLRTKLFGIGAKLLADLLPQYVQGKAKGVPQLGKDEPRAARFSRDVGYEPWDTVLKAFTNAEEASRIERKYRALHPWPGVWTTIATQVRPAALVHSIDEQEKRLKILKLHLNNGLLAIDEVQLEGKNPVSWQQFRAAYEI